MITQRIVIYIKEMSKLNIKITSTINLPIKKVWQYWTEPEHIVKWNYASEDWHTTYVTNDLKVGGKFLSRMEAKDGSDGFDFSGVYTKVIINERINNTLDDGRLMSVVFKEDGDKTNITEFFESEYEYPIDVQRTGWQNILDNFKTYAESQEG